MVSARWLSYLWPVRVARRTGAHGPLELTWENGRLVVNSDQANQSHGALHRVWQRVLAEAESSVREAGSVLLLGLGTGSVVHILRQELGLDTPITALEDDPLMIQWGREHFGLDKVEALRVV
ncbi:MAG TPA: spermine synthase, partial [Flavobacteriales bacterium]|nr:spermine synthase [Flavobacteriales bacterium]